MYYYDYLLYNLQVKRNPNKKASKMGPSNSDLPNTMLFAFGQKQAGQRVNMQRPKINMNTKKKKKRKRSDFL